MRSRKGIWKINFESNVSVTEVVLQIRDSNQKWPKDRNEMNNRGLLDLS